MLGIHIIAVVAVVVALAGIGTLIVLLARGRHLGLLAGLVAIQLPMSAVGLLLLRSPIDTAVRGMGLDPWLLLFVQSWYAPITEEPLKFLPFLVPIVFQAVEQSDNPRLPIAAGLALGLGFGVGEIGYLAWAFGQNPQVAALGAGQFGGFLIERVLTCFLHAAMTATAIWFWLRGKRWGLLVAINIHYAINLPIYLAAQRAFGLDRPTWNLVALGWVVIATIALALWTVWMVRNPPQRPQPASD